MTTCVEQCAREFAGDLGGLFGRLLTRAECKRMAVECDPCNPDRCVVARLLKKQHSETAGSGFERLTA
jgi:hypothetical protein